MTLEIDGIKVELSPGDTFEYLGDKKFKVTKAPTPQTYWYNQWYNQGPNPWTPLVTPTSSQMTSGYIQTISNTREEKN